MPEHQHHSHGWTWVSKLVFAGFLAIGAFFLFTEHRAHLFGALPWLLVLACPLMHLFHHHGHGRHGSSTPGSKPGRNHE